MARSRNQLSSGTESETRQPLSLPPTLVVQQERVASGEPVISEPISGVIDLTLDVQESTQNISTLPRPIFESYIGNSFLHNRTFQESTDCESRIPRRPTVRRGPIEDESETLDINSIELNLLIKLDLCWALLPRDRHIDAINVQQICFTSILEIQVVLSIFLVAESIEQVGNTDIFDLPQLKN